MQFQIEHAFGMIEAESGALTATHDAHSNLSSGNGLITDVLKHLGFFFEILVGGDVRHRFELLVLLGEVGLSFDINMLIELIGLLIIDVLELFKELFLEFRVLDGLVVLG